MAPTSPVQIAAESDADFIIPTPFLTSEYQCEYHYEYQREYHTEDRGERWKTETQLIFLLGYRSVDTGFMYM